MTDTTPPQQQPLRAVIVEDSELLRQSLARFLTVAGLEVAAQLGSAEALLAVVEREHPDVVILDVRLPPTHTDEGIEAAVAVRHAHPEVAVLVLSTYVEGAWAKRLFGAGASGVGYLLKDRVNESHFVDALRRVADGGTVVDPDVVTQLMAADRRSAVLEGLSPRERDVLTLMAQGRSNAGIGQALFLSPRTIEAHIASIFDKLGIALNEPSTNKRVLAVLTYLQDGEGGVVGGHDRG